VVNLTSAKEFTIEKQFTTEEMFQGGTRWGEKGILAWGDLLLRRIDKIP
jgi:hypothetical protein